MSAIVRARLRVLRAPVGDGIAMSFSPLRHRSMVLVELTTADGLTGSGESWVNYPPWAYVERVATLRDGVFPLVLGEDSRDIGLLRDELRTRLAPLARQWGAPGPVMQAISSVDMALWDIAGQRQRLAVSRLGVGRVRAEIPVYASSLGPNDVREQARTCVAESHRAAKVKLGFGRSADEAALAQAREELGPDVTLYADANQAWDLSEATFMAGPLRAYDVAWIEEPLRDNDLNELEELHRRTDLTIATGENMYGSRQFRTFAASPAIAVLQPDVAKAGGISELLSVCALAEAYDKQVFPHLYAGAVAFAATLQLCAMSAVVGGLEYDVRDNPLRDPLLVDAPRPHNGVIEIPDEPGLAVALDRDTIDAMTESETYVDAES